MKWMDYLMDNTQVFSIIWTIWWATSRLFSVLLMSIVRCWTNPDHYRCVTTALWKRTSTYSWASRSFRPGPETACIIAGGGGYIYFLTYDRATKPRFRWRLYQKVGYSQRVSLRSRCIVTNFPEQIKPKEQNTEKKKRKKSFMYPNYV